MLNVVKIGGNVIDNDANLQQFLNDFAALPHPKILIHGGGKLATRLSEKLEIPTQMIDGRRVTDAETLKVVTMVYAGYINKNIVAQLQALDCDSIGLSGADANVIPANRRAANPIDYGFVGDVTPAHINHKFIGNLIEQGITPVFCAITHDEKGSLLNSNADTVASSVAMAMAAHRPTKLTFCFEKNGVLSDPDDDTSVIAKITRDSYTGLKASGVVSGGMIPKIDNAYKAIDAGVKEVIIKNSADINNPDTGTTIL